ncbi:hypothetical protein VQ045_18170 [Aurantimonas sp. E1-2-R+4]|uniref:hypothetical protein n=1 Tax=Aurantimonas sp. E1-2-R+4 TaxID=3113714 RepID=UPI002F941815
MKIGTGIGLAALIVALISIFIPLAGLVLAGIGLVIACLGALFGDKGFAIATVVVTAVNYFFLSPSLWMSEAGSRVSGGSGNTEVWAFIVALLVAPIVCMILYSSGKIMLGKKAS